MRWMDGERWRRIGEEERGRARWLLSVLFLHSDVIAGASRVIPDARWEQPARDAVCTGCWRVRVVGGHHEHCQSPHEISHVRISSSLSSSLFSSLLSFLSSSFSSSSFTYFDSAILFSNKQEQAWVWRNQRHSLEQGGHLMYKEWFTF